MLKKDAEQTYDNYETMLNERYDGSVIDEKQVGLARELARMNLTLNTYTCLLYTSDAADETGRGGSTHHLHHFQLMGVN